MDRSKIIKMVIILAAITIIAGSLTRVMNRNSMSLAEYASLSSASDEGQTAKDNGSPAEKQPGTSQSEASPDSGADPQESPETDPSASPSWAQPEEADPPAPAPDTILTGAALNGSSQLENRTVWAEHFYYEPVSDNLRRYMTGISYPVTEGENAVSNPVITFEDLRYVHILYYNFDGESAEGELVCHEAIAQDLTEIFYELYRNEYQLEKVLLIDEYDGDDIASMEDNNTSCFNYRVVEGSKSLSRHAYGLAIDINPLYNPYITYEKDGTEVISPAAALSYADRSIRFAYKIDENDLCYKLFIEHGFTWGGNWNSVKDYQHFQKSLD